MSDPGCCPACWLLAFVPQKKVPVQEMKNFRNNLICSWKSTFMYGNTSFRSFIIGFLYIFHCLLFKRIDPDPAKKGHFYSVFQSNSVTKPVTVEGNPLVTVYLDVSQLLFTKERQYWIYKWNIKGLFKKKTTTSKRLIVTNILAWMTELSSFSHFFRFRVFPALQDMRHMAVLPDFPPFFFSVSQLWQRKEAANSFKILCTEKCYSWLKNKPYLRVPLQKKIQNSAQ